MTSTAQNFSRSWKEVEAMVFKVLVYEWQQDLKVEKHAKQHLFNWIIQGTIIFPFQKINGSYLGKKFYLLLMRGLFNSSTTHHSLWIDTNTQILTDLKQNWVCFYIQSFARLTQMCNKLLSDLHPLQQLLEEAVSETFLDGGDLLLHVL